MICSVAPDGRTSLMLTADETRAWATRPGKAWPCSVLSGATFIANFEPNGDLVDFELHGANVDDIPIEELNAIVSDHLPVGHPAAHSPRENEE